MSAPRVAFRPPIMSSPRRLLVFLALLPQILVLGPGGGVVVCFAPGGHVQIELAASACCADTPAGSHETETEAGSAEECNTGGASDCGSCTDFGIVVESRASRTCAGTDVDSGMVAALPREASALRVRGRLVLLGRRGSQSDLEPQHLIGLRSIRLRC